MNWRMVVPDIPVGFGNGFHHPGCAGHVDPPHAVDVQDPGALGIDHKRQMHNGRRLHLAQQQEQLAGGFFSSQIERDEAVNRGMSWGRDIDAHHLAIRKLLHEPLAKIARNAGDNEWLVLPYPFSQGRFRLDLRRARDSAVLPLRWRHGRIPGGAEVGIVQVNIALKTLHAVAVALAGNQFCGSPASRSPEIRSPC
jgi:hypothetical protein